MWKTWLHATMRLNTGLISGKRLLITDESDEGTVRNAASLIAVFPPFR